MDTPYRNPTNKDKMGGLRYAPSITNCKGVLKWNILYLTRINIAVFYKLF